MFNKFIRAYQDLLLKCLFHLIIKAQKINRIFAIELELKQDQTLYSLKGLQFY